MSLPNHRTQKRIAQARLGSIRAVTEPRPLHLAVIAALLLLLAACDTNRDNTHAVPTITLTGNPDPAAALEPGSTVRIEWRATNARSVSVTSTPPFDIPGNTDHAGHFETQLEFDTTFVVKADTQQSVIVYRVSPKNEPLPDPLPDEEEEHIEPTLAYSVNPDSHVVPADVTLTGVNLPEAFSTLEGNYSWHLFRAGFAGGDELLLTEMRPALTHTFRIEEPGTYTVRVEHPGTEHTEWYATTFTLHDYDHSLTVNRFEPNATSTTVEIRHNSDWQLAIPEWLETTDDLTGNGNATITLSLPAGTTPNEYSGEVILNRITSGTTYPLYTDNIYFAFPRFTGTVTTPWTTNPQPAATSRLGTQQATAEPAFRPASPPKLFTNEQGILMFLFDHNLEESAAALRAHPNVTDVSILRSLSILVVNTNDMQVTATAGSRLPGFLHVEEQQLAKPTFYSDDRARLDIELPPLDYFGTDWVNSPQGHLIRQNIHELHSRGLNGEGITIAVIDRGFHYDHEVYGDRIKGIYAPAYDEYLMPIGIHPEPALPASCNPYTHGISVAALAAGQANEPLHNNGIAPQADILLINMLEVAPDGHCYEGGINTVQLADFLINEGNPRADVVNMSWGIEDPTMYESPYDLNNLAFTAMREAGIILIAAAGNNAEMNTVVWPARLPDVIAVGGINASVEHRLAYTYENAGLDLLSIQQVNNYPSFWDGTQIRYGAVTGTSMAAPQVAGLMALYLQHANNTGADYSPDLLQKALELNAHKAYSALGDELTIANGVIDALATLEYLENTAFIPNHQISVFLNGTEHPISVRPDGTFITPYLPMGTHTLSLTTGLQSENGTWADTIEFEARSNDTDYPSLVINLRKQ